MCMYVVTLCTYVFVNLRVCVHVYKNAVCIFVFGFAVIGFRKHLGSII